MVWAMDSSVAPPAPSLAYALKARLTNARSLVWLARGAREAAAGARILFYHRISTDRDELSVAPDRFDAQMTLLGERGYRVVDVETLGELLRSGTVDERVIGLSFDDGYLDVVDNALPVLRRLGFRATVYVATGVIDGEARFAWYAAQPPLISWEQACPLDAEGVLRFEPHTVTHPDLTRLSEEDARAEIEGSKQALEARLGRRATSFCYPAGRFGPRELALVGDAGFATAVTCEPGVNRPSTDPLRLRRRQVDRRDTLIDFRAKVAGGHDTSPALRGAYLRVRYGRPTSV